MHFENYNNNVENIIIILNPQKPNLKIPVPQGLIEIQ